MEKWIRSLRGVVLDLDGTVYDDGELIDGAGDAIAAVRAAGLGLKFATNTSRYPCGTLIERLRRQGVDAAPDDVFTAPRAAAAWLLDRGITRISLHVSPMTVEEFTRFAIDEQQPEAVVVGDLGDDWTVERLNRVFRHVMGGAQLLAIQKNRYWKHGGTLCLDAGPFVAAIEYATATTAVVAGKPSAEFFAAAAAALDIESTQLVVVGDDLQTDVRGAQSVGARAALVKTGKFRDGDLDDVDVRLDLTLDSRSTRGRAAPGRLKNGRWSVRTHDRARGIHASVHRVGRGGGAGGGRAVRRAARRRWRGAPDRAQRGAHRV